MFLFLIIPPPHQALSFTSTRFIYHCVVVCVLLSHWFGCVCVCVCVCAQSCLTVCITVCECVCSVVSDPSVTSRTVARQAPLSMGFPRHEYWIWVAISFSRGSYPPRDRIHVSGVSCFGRQVLLTVVPPGKPYFLITDLNILIF